MSEAVTSQDMVDQISLIFSQVDLFHLCSKPTPPRSGQDFRSWLFEFCITAYHGLRGQLELHETTIRMRLLGDRLRDGASDKLAQPAPSSAESLSREFEQLKQRTIENISSVSGSPALTALFSDLLTQVCANVQSHVSVKAPDFQTLDPLIDAVVATLSSSSSSPSAAVSPVIQEIADVVSRIFTYVDMFKDCSHKPAALRPGEDLKHWLSTVCMESYQGIHGQLTFHHEDVTALGSIQSSINMGLDHVGGSQELQNLFYELVQEAFSAYESESHGGATIRTLFDSQKIDTLIDAVVSTTVSTSSLGQIPADVPPGYPIGGGQYATPYPFG